MLKRDRPRLGPGVTGSGLRLGTREAGLHLINAAQKCLYDARPSSHHVAVVRIHDSPKGSFLRFHVNYRLARRLSLGGVDNVYAFVDDRVGALSQELDDGLGLGVVRAPSRMGAWFSL